MFLYRLLFSRSTTSWVNNNTNNPLKKDLLCNLTKKTNNPFPFCCINLNIVPRTLIVSIISQTFLLNPLFFHCVHMHKNSYQFSSSPTSFNQTIQQNLNPPLCLPSKSEEFDNMAPQKPEHQPCTYILYSFRGPTPWNSNIFYSRLTNIQS